MESGSRKARRVFILGVGAQKAGTSWLFNYLASANNVATNGIKEYHIWDAVDDVPSFVNRRVTRDQSQASPALRIKYSLQQSPENYFNYFAYLLEKQARQVTCDITPAYAGLRRTTFATIREGFSRREVTTKAVFLLRDPIERCWSSARMRFMNTVGHNSVSDEYVVAHAEAAETDARTRYDMTIAELESAFHSSELHVSLYEEMFELPQLNKLSDFCQVSLRPALVEQRINLTRKTTALAEDAAAKIAARYRPVYEFVATRFPQAVKLWGGYRYL